MGALIVFSYLFPGCTNLLIRFLYEWTTGSCYICSLQNWHMECKEEWICGIVYFSNAYHCFIFLSRHHLSQLDQSQIRIQAGHFLVAKMYHSSHLIIYLNKHIPKEEAAENEGQRRKKAAHSQTSSGLFRQTHLILAYTDCTVYN